MKRAAPTAIASEIYAFEASSRAQAERIAVMIENAPAKGTKRKQRVASSAQNADEAVFSRALVDHEARLKQLIIAEWFTSNYRTCQENYDAQETARNQERQLQMLESAGSQPKISLRIEREIYARGGGGVRTRGSRAVPRVTPPAKPTQDATELFYQEKMSGMRKLLRVPQDLLPAARQSQHPSPYVGSTIRKKRSDLLEELNEAITAMGLKALSKKDWLWTRWFMHEFLQLPENANGTDAGKPIWLVPTEAAVQANNTAVLEALTGYLAACSQNKTIQAQQIV